MQPIRVLVADDEREIRELVKKYLERELYSVDTASNGEEALRLFELNKYNLVVLDLMMPYVDGIEVCRRIRERSNVPILMLTAKDEEMDKIVGLSIGADDYMTKPFSIHELIARSKAQLRRFMILGSEIIGSAVEDTLLRFTGLIIDTKKYTVMRDGQEVNLTAKEFELLKLFAAHPEQVFTKTQIFRQVWGSQYIEDDNTVMVHIRKLRLKIETNPSEPKLIQTVWGIGYKFAGEKDET
ncbi:response regulator transcription factor [Paenibacillus alvei]|uniref:Response regulator transcription factor n=1 Tax=Paenibacillus alvei TaxID=44250 RepID=A0AAP6ZZL9_PAEAL|nr:response regulator transcription factor [Paenibacillus alvei]MBG9735599.1 PhoP family transcriptional regulator [Paenibacillus alvei]MBG9746671.1 PhoP family transcriptional regulator [Paenibacillus alvei]MCY9578446.1 response regulator transcription factor [Paenibacillus alvei]MCY9584767.1 response regulator transcription factor [Paenibacillus alvei]NEZ41156.1 response regulator [Paenibacillus alvei]